MKKAGGCGGWGGGGEEEGEGGFIYIYDIATISAGMIYMI